MDKNQILARLCKLASDVNKEVFKHNKASDCFCGEKPTNNFQFEDDILLFIERAVQKEINYLTYDRREREIAETHKNLNFADLFPEIRKLAFEKQNGEINPAYKIAAIKLIRLYTGYGLTESKYASENWIEFKAFFEKNNRFPQLTGDYCNYQMV